MDDFTTAPGAANQFGLMQGAANDIAPGKRPLSSMAPTIVLKDGKVAMVLGSPGGPRIITAIVQTILNMVDYDMDAQEAVDAPRLHHQWMPDLLFAEPFALSPDTRALLEEMGYRIQDQRPSGAVALIASGAMGGRKFMSVGADTVATHAPMPDVYYGANDSRRPAGVAVAP
jgi:gamma-glutamyltranspeptidase / glutathione hydrolase